jgi:hypothetical protein
MADWMRIGRLWLSSIAPWAPFRQEWLNKTDPFLIGQHAMMEAT